MHDSSVPVIHSGTGSKCQILAAVSGKNNTGLLLKATNTSTIVATNAISSGFVYVAASTSASNPIQWGSTTSTTGTPACVAGGPCLDSNGNGIFHAYPVNTPSVI